MRRLLVTILMGIIATAVLAIRTVETVNPALPAAPQMIDEARTPSQPMPAEPAVGPIRATDELNETWQIGATYTDFFSHGSHNRFLQRDSAGGLHASWMNHRNPLGNRIVNYCYRAPNGSWSTPTQVFDNGAGYNQQEILSDGKAVLSAHQSVPAVSPISGYASLIAIDTGYQQSRFRYEILPTPEHEWADTFYNPCLVVDRNDVVHVMARRFYNSSNESSYRFYYTRSDTMQRNFTPFTHAIRTYYPAVALASSRTSNKVAVAWAQTAIPNGYADQPGWRGFLVQDYNNDLWIAQSTDGGTTWNFDDTLHNNITKFRIWDQEKFALSHNHDTLWAAGDTFRFINTSAMLYDNNDNLHIVFNICQLYEDYTVNINVNPRIPAVKRTGFTPTLLYHWTDANPDTFTVVADGWWWPTARDDRQPPRWRQETRTTIDRMSLSIASNNELYCAYTMYGNPINHIDTSANGYACGNVWVTHSNDNGATWYRPTPITDTTNNAGAISGNAHSRIWPSMPETIDNDSLYIMYFDDRSGGSAWVDGNTTPSPLQNDWTLNQVYVQSVARSAIHSDSTLQYPEYPSLKIHYEYDVNTPVVWMTNPLFDEVLSNPFWVQWGYDHLSDTNHLAIDICVNYPDILWRRIATPLISAGSSLCNIPEELIGQTLRLRISVLTNPDIFEITPYNHLVGLVKVEEQNTNLPHEYAMYSAAPNPFNPTTTIQFALPQRERVTLKVYDIAGREIATLADDVYNAGEQRITWRPERLSSGVYFVKMTAGRYTATQKVVFLK